jgi:hypothetical protein
VVGNVMRKLQDVRRVDLNSQKACKDFVYEVFETLRLSWTRKMENEWMKLPETKQRDAANELIALLDKLHSGEKASRPKNWFDAGACYEDPELGFKFVSWTAALTVEALTVSTIYEGAVVLPITKRTILKSCLRTSFAQEASCCSRSIMATVPAPHRH